ncbi:uncharacterized protein LOC111710368 isoform X2 [Eurytemora carolleeae]|uniref:uncharacterized protein LOC111710368 isoform X2 n=1 Tax=Eurytemora carolleeae TaxID=1294199 RepID=UPI000C758221|nr:uncharacterized protein LOC111710368 isoform X2 [Eurytemora carolleeae]|eukprot:XP_023340209.1 uncharacterized protein LOC111710368 isoform X2 [Eurytemora affinis]
MLEEEVKRRRAELLKKFRLDSDRIPIRSDFEKKAPAKAAVKIPEPPNFGKSTAAAPPPPISNPASAVEVVSNMWQTLTSDTIKLPSPGSTPQHRAPVVQPKPKLVPTLRLIGAFHDYLGPLGDPLDDLLSKAVSLEKSYEGASRILVEDSEVLATLESVRIRLIARKNDGSIDPALFGSLDNCLQNLNRNRQFGLKFFL